MIIDYDNDGQIIFGDLGGLKVPDICLTGEENPEKTSPRKLVPTRARRACYHLARAADLNNILTLFLLKTFVVSVLTEVFCFLRL